MTLISRSQFGRRGKERQTMQLDKIKITTTDVDDLDALAGRNSAGMRHVPLWWRLLSALLVFCPPLLFIMSILNLIAVRRKDLHAKYAYALHYCWLLLASGVFWMIAGLAFALWGSRTLPEQVPTTSSLLIDRLPSLPSEYPLSGKDIARQLSPLVVIVRGSDQGIHFPWVRASGHAYGAGAIVLADHDGCLMLTSRHVVEAISRLSDLGQVIGVSLQDGQYAQATVVGMHTTLDLALLWAERQKIGPEFIQPLHRYKTVEVGEQIFAFGTQRALTSLSLVGLWHRNGVTT
jgi:S1-C subfamily serine protease